MAQENWHLRQEVPANPIVFFGVHTDGHNTHRGIEDADVSIGGVSQGRIQMELWADLCPKTAENFRQLCIGEVCKNGVPQGYKDCTIHRVVRNFVIQGGDFIRGDGTGVFSIYGGHFDDENFVARHTGPGLLSMANSGKNANGSQFFITCNKTEHLDGKHVVFGRVIKDGLRTVRQIENVPTAGDRPKLAVVISQCGEM